MTYLGAKAEALGLDESGIPAVYLTAVHWAKRSFGEATAAA